MNKQTKILIGIVIALVIGLGVSVYTTITKTQENNDMRQEIEINKQELEDDYESLSMQYETMKFSIKNDSLLYQLNGEQAKVQRLLEELKTVKATNRTEINRLNKELNTLRQILRTYVVQIDSLNRANQQLKIEKQEITNKYQQATQTLNKVSQERKNLSEKVSLASKLDATGIIVQAVNKKGKIQKKIKKIEQFVVNFIITKNITAEPGERTIYVRIMKPDDDVLTKSRTNVFEYENREIDYSMKRIVEYGGEEIQVTLYWDVEEYLTPGKYRVDIFADGSRIGSKSFELKN